MSLLTRAEIDALAGAAPVEGWTHVSHESPAVGQRVDVMHVLARSYDTNGEIGEDGRWQCCNGFVLPGGRCGVLTFSPSHWRPMSSPAASAASSHSAAADDACAGDRP